MIIVMIMISPFEKSSVLRDIQIFVSYKKQTNNHSIDIEIIFYQKNIIYGINKNLNNESI